LHSARINFRVTHNLIFTVHEVIHRTPRGTLIFWVTYITKSSTTSQPINQPAYTIENRNVWDFFRKKTSFGTKTKKIAANFCNRGIQTVRPRTLPTSPRIKRQKHTRRRNGADESAAMIEGWNWKYIWKHVCMQAALVALH